jgi:hypothetical protein
LISKDARWLRSVFASPFIVAGQHSLPVFCAGIFLSFLGRLATEADDGFFAQVGVNLAGAVALWSVGAVAAWYSIKGKRKPPPAAAAEAA